METNSQTVGEAENQPRSPVGLTKSRQRIADHGEVFTPEWMVESMLDLVMKQSELIQDS